MGYKGVMGKETRIRSCSIGRVLWRSRWAWRISRWSRSRIRIGDVQCGRPIPRRLRAVWVSRIGIIVTVWLRLIGLGSRARLLSRVVIGR